MTTSTPSLTSSTDVRERESRHLFDHTAAGGAAPLFDELGKLARNIADQALDMHGRMQREFTRTLPPATADASPAGYSSPAAAASPRTAHVQLPAGQLGADAYMKLMEKYGYGTNPIKALTGHLDRMGREIGLMRMFGPSFEANFRALMKEVWRKPEVPIGGARPRAVRPGRQG